MFEEYESRTASGINAHIISQEQYHDFGIIQKHISEDLVNLRRVMNQKMAGCSCQKCVAQCVLCSNGVPTPEHISEFMFPELGKIFRPDT